MAPIIFDVSGRPSPWANEPHESAWRQAIATRAREVVAEPYGATVRPSRVVVEFRLTPRRKGDLDNLAKPVLDTLFRQSRISKHPVACIFTCDDFYLSELILRRIEVSGLEEEGATIIIEF